MLRSVFLGFALWIGLGAMAAGQAAESVLLLDDAEIAVMDSATPPPESAPWQRQRLPDDWRDSRPGFSGVAWYRLRFELAAPPTSPWGLYLPVLRRAGTVYVNDRLAAASESQRAWYPQYFDLAPGLFRVGSNVIHLRVQTVPRSAGVLSRVWVGAVDAVRDRYQQRMWLQILGVQMFCVVLLALGTSTLAIWWRRRDETAYGYFGLQQLGTALYVSLFFVRKPWIPDPYWSSLHNSLWVCNVLMSLFALRYVGWRWPRVEAALWAYVVIEPVITFATALGYLPSLGLSWNYAATSLEFIYVGIFAVNAWRHPTTKNILLALLAPAIGLSDVYDLWWTHSPEDLLLEPYQFLPFCALVSWILLERFITSLNESEKLNAELEQRVEQKQTELRANFQRLQRLEREQAIAEERSRIMSDMHDGIGAQLISTIGLAEHGQLTQQEMAVALRECLDDLRLTIDSLEPTENDLLPVLGNFRYRVDPRLRQQGISLDWRVSDLPRLACLTPRNLLHVLRILQEAFTNVLKHAGASLIRVETGLLPEAQQVYIRVSDNGTGFIGDHRGRGLTNMRQRAESIGGKLQVQSSGKGTTLELQLPVTLAAGTA
jgi:signal transduction histidine kinase